MRTQKHKIVTHDDLGDIDNTCDNIASVIGTRLSELSPCIFEVGMIESVLGQVPSVDEFITIVRTVTVEHTLGPLSLTDLTIIITPK